MTTKEQKREHYAKHKDKIKARSREWYFQNRPRRMALNRKLILKKKYGMTLDDYHALVLKQNGKCAICDATAPLKIDHDHDTGEVRGLLCLHCNTGLGHFRESIALLHWAANYLSGGKLVELWVRGAA